MPSGAEVSAVVSGLICVYSFLNLYFLLSQII